MKVLKNVSNISKNTALVDLVQSGFWSVIGTLISKFLLFLIWIFVAKILKATLYGEFSIIKSTTILFSDLVGVSLGAAATNYIAKYHQKNNGNIVEKLIGVFNSFSLFFGLLLCLLSLVFANFIAENILQRTDLTIYIKASSLVILFASINNNQLGILRGFNQYKIISKINLLQIIFAFPVYYLGTYFFSLKGAIFGYVFYNFIICLLARAQICKFLKKSKIQPIYIGNKNEIRMVTTFILPYLISGLFVALLSWYNETRLVSLDNGYEEMGYYSSINIILSIIIGVSTMVCIPFVSIMSKYRETRDASIIEELNIILPMQVSIFIAIPFILVPEVISCIYGNEYDIEKLRIFSKFMFFYSVLAVYRQGIARYVAVKEKTWLYFFESFIFAFLSVISFYFLKKFTVQGFVWGQTISYVIVTIFFFPLYVKCKIIPRHLLHNKLFYISFFVLIMTLLISFINLSILIRVVLCLIIIVLDGLYCMNWFNYVKNN